MTMPRLEGADPGPADDRWVAVLPTDPRPWLRASDEPAARWIALTALDDRTADDPEVRAAHAAVLADAGTRDLIGRIPAWGAPLALPGHDSLLFAPNLLGLLAEMGVRAGDDPRIDTTLDAMLEGRTPDGRFATFASSRVTPGGAWSALLCDTHAIAAVLVRFGRGDDPRVVAELERMADGIVETPSGRAWSCVPWGGFRGPGRKGDRCPQVTLQALRAFSIVPPSRRPAGLDDVARAALRPWREREAAQPYMFGHGYRFKSVKWPSFWYDVLRVVETVGAYPEVWRGPDAREEDRGSVAELAACLVAYNVDADGTVTPRSAMRGFESFSFGQKKAPSAFATARVCQALRPLGDLADAIRDVDVRTLGSSKGGTGTPRPPAARQSRAAT
jgi:hypothetical protein